LAALDSAQLPTDKRLAKWVASGSEPELRRFKGFIDVKNYGDAGDCAGEIAGGWYRAHSDYKSEVLWRRADVSCQILHLRRQPDLISRKGCDTLIRTRPHSLVDALNSLAVAERDVAAEESELPWDARERHFRRAAEAYKHMHEMAVRFLSHPRFDEADRDGVRVYAQKALYGLGRLHMDLGECLDAQLSVEADPVGSIRLERRLEATLAAARALLLQAHQHAESLPSKRAERRVDALVLLANLHLEWGEHAHALGCLAIAEKLQARLPSKLAADVTYTVASVLRSLRHYTAGELVIAEPRVDGSSTVWAYRTQRYTSAQEKAEAAISAIELASEEESGDETLKARAVHDAFDLVVQIRREAGETEAAVSASRRQKGVRTFELLPAELRRKHADGHQRLKKIHKSSVAAKATYHAAAHAIREALAHVSAAREASASASASAPSSPPPESPPERRTERLRAALDGALDAAWGAVKAEYLDVEMEADLSVREVALQALAALSHTPLWPSGPEQSARLERLCQWHAFMEELGELVGSGARVANARAWLEAAQQLHSAKGEGQAETARGFFALASALSEQADRTVCLSAALEMKTEAAKAFEQVLQLTDDESTRLDALDKLEGLLGTIAAKDGRWVEMGERVRQDLAAEASRRLGELEGLCHGRLVRPGEGSLVTLETTEALARQGRAAVGSAPTVAAKGAGASGRAGQRDPLGLRRDSNPGAPPDGGAGALRCRKGHLLKRERSMRSLKCDVCSRRIDAGVLAFSCQPCDHDMCLACGNVLKGAQRPATQPLMKAMAMRREAMEVDSGKHGRREEEEEEEEEEEDEEDDEDDDEEEEDDEPSDDDAHEAIDDRSEAADESMTEVDSTTVVAAAARARAAPPDACALLVSVNAWGRHLSVRLPDPTSDEALQADEEPPKGHGSVGWLASHACTWLRAEHGLSLQPGGGLYVHEAPSAPAMPAAEPHGSSSDDEGSLAWRQAASLTIAPPDECLWAMRARAKPVRRDGRWVEQLCLALDAPAARCHLGAAEAYRLQCRRAQLSPLPPIEQVR
jgi:hypothetical protein